MKKILFIDSGSGGINVLAHAIKKGLGGDFLYYADMKNLPYGDKNKRELEEIAKQILQNVYEFFKFEIVVFACNTLTTSAIEKMRKTFSQTIFIGVEPAVRPALKKFKQEEVLLMATNRTLENMWWEGVCVPNLPKLIDENLLSLEKLEEYVTLHLQPYKDRKAIVLGCTHYLAIKGLIQKNFPQIKIFDSNEGVVNRLKTFTGKGDYKVQFMSSGNFDNSIISNYFQKLLNF